MNRKFFALAACVAAVSLCTTAAVAALPGPAGFSFAKGAKFTVAGYAAGKPTLSGFPVLVRLQANAPVGFSYADLQNAATDADLCFVDMDGNGLPFEIDTWNASGESLVWVRLPTMTNGTEFVMCWGGGTSGKTVCDASPFSGYVGVWHMSEASGTVADSSGHSLDAVPTGEGATTLSIAVSGPVGNGRQCSTNTSTRSYLTVPTYDSMNVGNTFAVSGWFNVGSGQSVQDARLFCRKTNYTEGNGWEVVWKKGGEFSTRGASSTADAEYSPAPSFGSGWKHFFIVYDNTTSTVFENGVQKVQKTGGTAATDNNVDLGIGDYPGNANKAPVVGSVDECRLLDAVPGADWAWAEYASMNDASFLTAGEAESYGALVDLGSATTLPSPGITELYVDSLGSGNGSSPESALPTIREALDIAGPGFTIWVRGGEDRSYVVSNETDTLRISAELAGLSIRAYGETPGDGGRAAFSVSPSYIDDGNRIHIVSNAATDVTLAGFTCSYGPRSLGVQNKGSVLLIAVAAPRFTIADCEFFCTGIPGYAGSGANGIVAAIKVNDNWHVATGMLVERCFFHDTTGYRGDTAPQPLRVATGTTIRECVFSNAWRIAADPGPGKTKFRDFTFVSNVVHSGPMRDASYFSFPHGLFSSGWGGLGGGAEIAYNVFVGTGEPNRGILALARWDGLGGSERFHHNVVCNYGWVWGYKRDGNPTGKTVAEIFDNVFDLMDGGTIVRDEGFDGETPRVGTPIFHTGSFSRNNAIVASGAFWGGASALAEDYDRSVVSPLDDIAIDEPPDWVCTNDLFHADFYRYRTSRTAPVDLGVLAWRGENGEYPRWIGAKPPLYPSATMLILR